MTKPRHSPDPLSDLEALLRHQFTRPDLLKQALVHRSLASDSGQAGPEAADNERLEFLGDAALGLFAAEILYAEFPHADEGDLTRMRVSVITRTALAEVGARLGVGRWLRMGQTAEENRSRESPRVLCNTVEALIAALYLDGGPEIAREFVRREVLGPALPGMVAKIAAEAEQPRVFKGAAGDFKTELQEWLRAAGRGQPEYRLLAESGPVHARVFQVEVGVVGEPAAGAMAAASGRSKKQAQQEAARLALVDLKAGVRRAAGS